MEKETVEIQIEPSRIISVTGSVRDIFSVVRGLKEDRYQPLVRFPDEELRDWTCWQPTDNISKAA